MNGKYGYEHINFTHRCVYHKIIPYACDIIDSLDYMDHIGFEPIGYNQYNKNHRCAKHKDGRNVGESYIIGLGDYTGGELMVWDENDKNPKKHNIRNKFYKCIEKKKKKKKVFRLIF